MARVAPWATVALIVLAPHLLGGAFAWSVPIVCAGALLCLVLALAGGARDDEAPHAVVWASIFTTVWTALQLVPLGPALLEKIAPERTLPLRLIGLALGRPLGAGATAVTFDPAATRLELLKGCALLCTTLACYLLARRGHARTLLAAVAGSGSVMGLVALGHRAVDAQSVYGLYRWQLVAPRLPAPILNDNCLAGFMVLTTPVAVSLALSARDARLRVAFYGGALASATTGLLTGSRAGTGAMVFALLCMVLAVQLRTRVRRDRWKQAAVAGALAAVALASAVVVGAEPLMQALGQRDYSKLDFIGDAFARAFLHPWFGVGRGAFSVATASLMDDAGRYVHAENFLATWATEWGFPVALGLTWVVGNAVAKLCLERSLLKVGVGVGLLSFAGQNLLDLGLELIGIAVVAAASLAAALGDTERYVAARPWVLNPNLARVGWACGALSMMCLLAFSPSAIAYGDDGYFARLDRAKAEATRDVFKATLAEAAAAHPLEPFLYMAAAREAVDHRDPVALRWLNLAMLQAPRWSGPHAEAARFLALVGRPGQAALEAREATKLNPVAGATAACDVARATPNTDLLMVAAEAALGTEGAPIFFARLFRCVPPTLIAQIDQVLLARGAGIEGSVLREYKRLVDAGRGSEGLALLAREAQPKSPSLQVLLAYMRALLEVRDLAALDVQMSRARKLGAPREAVAAVAAELATIRGDAPGMRAAVEELRAEAASSGPKLAAAALLLAKFEERLGNLDQAESALEDAALLNPTVGGLRALLAFMVRHEKMGKALSVRATLCARSPQENECRPRKR